MGAWQRSRTENGAEALAVIHRRMEKRTYITSRSKQAEQVAKEEGVEGGDGSCPPPPARPPPPAALRIAPPPPSTPPAQTRKARAPTGMRMRAAIPAALTPLSLPYPESRPRKRADAQEKCRQGLASLRHPGGRNQQREYVALNWWGGGSHVASVWQRYTAYHLALTNRVQLRGPPENGRRGVSVFNITCRDRRRFWQFGRSLVSDAHKVEQPERLAQSIIDIVERWSIRSLGTVRCLLEQMHGAESA